MKKLMLVIAIFIIGGCSAQKDTEKTNELYLIPSGFEGSIMVFYNVSKTPTLKKEGKFTVIPVVEASLKQLEGSNINRYGIYLTSTPDMNYGIEENKYFYVDKVGERTVIDEKCTFTRGNGSFTTESGNEIVYKTIQITNNDCSQDFSFYGKEIYDIQEREVKKYWMDHLD